MDVNSAGRLDVDQDKARSRIMRLVSQEKLFSRPRPSLLGVCTPNDPEFCDLNLINEWMFQML